MFLKGCGDEAARLSRIIGQLFARRSWRKALKEALTPAVKLASVVHTSNLDGYTLPAREIAEICHDAGALVMLDAAQSAAHAEVDAQKLDVDFLAASAHKFCGPSGTGLLYGKADALAALKPTFAGGSTVRNSTYDGCEFLPPPACFEAGLQNYSGILVLMFSQ